MGTTALYRNPHQERPGYRTKSRFSFEDFELAETEVNRRSREKAKQEQEKLRAHAQEVHGGKKVRITKPTQPKRPCNLYNVSVDVEVFHRD